MSTDKRTTKELNDSLDEAGYFEHVMRMGRVYYIAAANREQAGEALTEDEESLKNLALAYCALYEKHTGTEIWDLTNTGFGDDIKELKKRAGKVH